MSLRRRIHLTSSNASHSKKPSRFSRVIETSRLGNDSQSPSVVILLQIQVINQTGLFCFSAVGLFISDKLEEIYPVPEVEKVPTQRRKIDLAQVDPAILERERLALEELTK